MPSRMFLEKLADGRGFLPHGPVGETGLQFEQRVSCCSGVSRLTMDTGAGAAQCPVLKTNRPRSRIQAVRPVTTRRHRSGSI